MHPGIGKLHALANELRALLGQLGAEGGGAWADSWERCQALFDEFRKDAPMPAALQPEEGQALAQALSDVVRLNAVAAGVAARESERLAESLQRVGISRRIAKKRNEDADGAAQRGDACDVRG